MKTDADDLEKVNSKFVMHSLFSKDPSLRNIIVGVVAEEGVNVHEYDTVEHKIMQKMIGQSVI